MAAEDPGDALATVEQSSGDLTGNSGVNSLEPAVRDWLAARIEGAPRAVLLSVVVLPGRCLFRTELGATASSLDVPFRSDPTSAELLGAVRRWARARSLAHRVEPSRNGEVRITFTPASASHS